MRIVSVTHYYPSKGGGIEAVAYEINRRLADAGHHVDWFATASSRLPECPPTVTFHPVAAINLIERYVGIPMPIWFSREILGLWVAIRQSDAVHIHDFIYPGSMLALIFGRIHRKPVILTQHIGEIPYRSAFLTRLLKLINVTVGSAGLRIASRVVFISNSVEDYFRRFVHFKTPPIYIPNGVDLNTFNPVSELERLRIRERLGLALDMPVFLFVGRFVEKKGMQLLEKIAPVTTTIQWVFAGEGPLHPSQWGAQNIRVYEGWTREKLAQLYRCADLLVLPSRGEGFPLVVQESFACGTPVIVSTETAKGCKRAMHLLYSLPIEGEEDHPMWLKGLISLSHATEELRAKRKLVAKFSRGEWDWDAAAKRYLSLYRDPEE